MYLNGTVKSAFPENHMFGTNLAALAFVQAELWPILCENWPIFVTIAAKVGPENI